MEYKIKRFSSKSKREENRNRDLEQGKMECGKWDKTFEDNHRFHIQERQDSGKPEVSEEETYIKLGRNRRHRMNK